MTLRTPLAAPANPVTFFPQTAIMPIYPSHGPSLLGSSWLDPLTQRLKLQAQQGINEEEQRSERAASRRRTQRSGNSGKCYVPGPSRLACSLKWLKIAASRNRNISWQATINIEECLISSQCILFMYLTCKRIQSFGPRHTVSHGTIPGRSAGSYLILN